MKGFDRFTDRARKVMALAKQESHRFKHKYIGTEHMLLGLVKEGSGVACAALNAQGVGLDKVCTEVEKLVKAGSDTVTMDRLPRTPRAKRVIEFAVEEARALGHNYVGTEHLLLGLMDEREGLAAQVLINLGVKLEEVRQEVVRLLDPAEKSEPDERERTEQTRSEIGPAHIDMVIRSAIQFCWTPLRMRMTSVDEVEKEIRRLLDRALREMRQDDGD